jgi:hypothetical protein
MLQDRASRSSVAPDEPVRGPRRGSESAGEAVENLRSSILFEPGWFPFHGENCDPDVTVFDKILPKAPQTSKTPKKAALAPVFCFTSKP